MRRAPPLARSIRRTAHRPCGTRCPAFAASPAPATTVTTGSQLTYAFTVANAGHIPPYLAGRELALNNGLPLGISADVTYSESVFALTASQQLTLLTDGVPEAQNKQRKLLGFDRTIALSTQPAESIANAAQHFGQNDDITVLTIALLPASG